jgi:hypothetical protein
VRVGVGLGLGVGVERGVGIGGSPRAKAGCCPANTNNNAAAIPKSFTRMSIS